MNFNYSLLSLNSYLETTIWEKREKLKENREKNKKKRQSSVENCRFFLVEMARFELASEDPFPKLSTSVVYLLSFPFEIADKQAKSKGSPLNPYKLQGSHLCRCTAKMTPLTESRYFQSGWAAIKQQLKLFYYCQLFLSCDFYSGATPLLAYLGSKSPSKSFHPRIFRFAQVKSEKWIVKNCGTCGRHYNDYS